MVVFSHGSHHRGWTTHTLLRLLAVIRHHVYWDILCRRCPSARYAVLGKLQAQTRGGHSWKIINTRFSDMSCYFWETCFHWSSFDRQDVQLNIPQRRCISCTLVNNHHFRGLAGLANAANLRRPTWRISVERKRTTLDTYRDLQGLLKKIDRL